MATTISTRKLTIVYTSVLAPVLTDQEIAVAILDAIKAKGLHIIDTRVLLEDMDD